MTPEDDFARLKAEKDQQYAGMIEAAGDIFQMYSAYQAAGFTAEQSLQLVLAVITAGLGGES